MGLAKTKALISFTVTTKLICIFVFAYADCWFSHAVAQVFSIHSTKCYEGSYPFPSPHACNLYSVSYVDAQSALKH